MCVYVCVYIYIFIYDIHVQIFFPYRLLQNIKYVFFIYSSLIIYFIFYSQSVQSLSLVRLFATPWTAARQPSLSITNSQRLHKLMSIESVMPSNHLILCRLLLLQPSIFSGIRVFSNKSVLPIMRPKYWSFSFTISPFNEYSGLLSFRID